MGENKQEYIYGLGKNFISMNSKSHIICKNKMNAITWKLNLFAQQRVVWTKQKMR